MMILSVVTATMLRSYHVSKVVGLCLFSVRDTWVTIFPSPTDRAGSTFVSATSMQADCKSI